MGIFGGAIGSVLGSEIGSGIGKTLDRLAGKKGRRIVAKLGGSIGKIGGGIAEASLIPFKNGGRVNAPKNKPVPAILHGQEYVLPVGIKPTKAQVQAVAMNKRNMK